LVRGANHDNESNTSARRAIRSARSFLKMSENNDPTSVSLR
jgi:hypothetical protein